MLIEDVREKVSFVSWLWFERMGGEWVRLFGEGFFEVLLRVEPEVHIVVVFTIEGRVASGFGGFEE